MDIVNATIGNTFLGIEDHGILSIMLYMDFGNVGQGFGGWSLDYHRSCSTFIRGCLEVTESNSWEAINGKHVRCKRDKGLIVAIGHITKDIWFEPSKDLKEE